MRTSPGCSGSSGSSRLVSVLCSRMSPIFDTAQTSNSIRQLCLAANPVLDGFPHQVALILDSLGVAKVGNHDEAVFRRGAFQARNAADSRDSTAPGGSPASHLHLARVLQ